MSAKDVSVIIPAFNASHCLELHVREVHRFMSGQGCDFEIIIVDDGSTDETPDIATRLGHEFSEIIKIRTAENRGKGHAVRIGILAAKGRLRLYTDADGSTNISHYADAVAKIREGFDIVIASRSPKDAPGAVQEIPQGIVRRAMGCLGNAAIKIAGLRGIYDTQCGFKLFKESAAMKLFKLSVTNGWGFDFEILMLANKIGYRTAIIPVRWRHNTKSSVGPASYISTLLELIAIRYRIATHFYGI